MLRAFAFCSVFLAFSASAQVPGMLLKERLRWQLWVEGVSELAPTPKAPVKAAPKRAQPHVRLPEELLRALAKTQL